MWPVGYLIGSPYSPLHIEQAHPQREWRDAFEDLLAVELGDEMISSESRQEEKAAARQIHSERAAHCISKANGVSADLSEQRTLLELALEKARREINDVMRSWVLEKLRMGREVAQHNLEYAEKIRSREEVCKELSASKRKAWGQ